MKFKSEREINEMKNSKAYKEYLSGPLDDMDYRHERGDDWSGYLYTDLDMYYSARGDGAEHMAEFKYKLIDPKDRA